MEKAFDRVNHSFMFAVLEKMGFGSRFIGWLKIMYKGVGSRVMVNGHMSAVVAQRTGVRQGCPLSPLLFVAYMEPLGSVVRRDLGVVGLHLPGEGAEQLKMTQYADDMTFFLTTERSVTRLLEIVEGFSGVSGAKVNLGKSTIKFFGPWADRVGGLAGLSQCQGPMRVLGVDFNVEGSAGLNWGRHQAAARSRMGLWKTRKLSLSGRVLAVKADILPSLIYLAYVYPLPPEYRRGFVRDVFSFVWGGMNM